MDEQTPAATGQDNQSSSSKENRRIENTTHVIYPEVDFVNRTDI